MSDDEENEKDKKSNHNGTDEENNFQRNENEKKEGEEEKKEGEKEEIENNGGNENIEEKNYNKEPFWFLEKTNEEIKDDSSFEDNKGKYKYCICLLMKDDSDGSSQFLEKTLKEIEDNLQSLDDLINIKGEHIILFIFINKIYNNHFFNENDKDNLEGKDNTNFPFLMKDRTIIKEESLLNNLKVYTIANNNYLSDISSLKLYYKFLDKLKDKSKLMFSSIITAGVIPSKDSLISLMQSSFHTNNKHGIVVAPIEYIPNNIFSKISQYEKIHFNIFNMNYYFESSTVPISSLLCTMCFDNNLLKFLNDYYENSIYENATIDFHDYNLSLNLIRASKGKYFIKYNYSKSLLGNIEINNMTYLDYQKQWINRNSGYYGNFFEILRVFGDCNACKIEEKIFLFFQLIAIAIEFILPSLFSMVINSILYEAFGTYDYRVPLFFTTLYLCMMFASGVCSLITSDPRRMAISNYILYIFMEVYYAFVIICSVPAMHYVNIHEDYISNYKFNRVAASLLIILSFIIYIIPLIMNISTLGNNIVCMFLYLLLGASCSTSNFNIAKIWNASDTSGGNKTEIKKSVCIIIYLCFNLFFGSLSFYNTSRKKRANCIMGFGIMFLIYSFFRTLAIIIKIACKKEVIFKDKEIFSKIKEKLEEDNDISINKEKAYEFNENEEQEINKDKNNEKDNNNNNDNNQSNSNNGKEDNNNDQNNSNKNEEIQEDAGEE